jgi:hypothetical protein
MPPANKNRNKTKKAAPAASSGPPNPGSTYKAHRQILIGGDAHDALRRVVAIKSPPGPPEMWITLGRSSTDHQPGDLETPPEPACDWNKAGWISMRFKHSIETRWLGNPVVCPYTGELSEETRIKVLTYYDDNS